MNIEAKWRIERLSQTFYDLTIWFKRLVLSQQHSEFKLPLQNFT
jgi:hypothetical protein